MTIFVLFYSSHSAVFAKAHSEISAATKVILSYLKAISFGRQPALLTSGFPILADLFQVELGYHSAFLSAF